MTDPQLKSLLDKVPDTRAPVDRVPNFVNSAAAEAAMDEMSDFALQESRRRTFFAEFDAMFKARNEAMEARKRSQESEE